MSAEGNDFLAYEPKWFFHSQQWLNLTATAGIDVNIQGGLFVDAVAGLLAVANLSVEANAYFGLWTELGLSKIFRVHFMETAEVAAAFEVGREDYALYAQKIKTTAGSLELQKSKVQALALKDTLYGADCILKKQEDRLRGIGSAAKGAAVKIAKKGNKACLAMNELAGAITEATEKVESVTLSNVKAAGSLNTLAESIKKDKAAPVIDLSGLDFEP